MGHPFDPQPNRRPGTLKDNVIAAVVLAVTLGAVFLLLSFIL